VQTVTTIGFDSAKSFFLKAGCLGGSKTTRSAQIGVDQYLFLTTNVARF
jgi:hypothetical protein